MIPQKKLHLKRLAVAVAVAVAGAGAFSIFIIVCMQHGKECFKTKMTGTSSEAEVGTDSFEDVDTDVRVSLIAIFKAVNTDAEAQLFCLDSTLSKR